MTGSWNADDAERTVFRPHPQRSDLVPPLTEGPTAAQSGAGSGERRSLRSDDDLPAPPTRARPRNPIIEAAAPLLTLASSIRAMPAEADLRGVHRHAAALAERFDALLVEHGVEDESRRRARYAVYATLDDVVQNLPGRTAEAAEWARRSMVVRGFGENIGGDRFWQLLDAMLARPSENAGLVELYHACLAVGFEGRYRLGDARGRLRAIQREAYAALPQVRTLSEVELAPAWRGTSSPRRPSGAWQPMVVLASGSLTVLLLGFLMFRLLLIGSGQSAMDAMLSVSPTTPLRLSRAAPAPTLRRSDQTGRLEKALADDVARRVVVIDQDVDGPRVRTTVGSLFAPGSDTLEPGMAALFERIADATKTEPGAIRIEGHADVDPVSSVTFPDNVSLSKARAEQVASIFQARLRGSRTIAADGFGATRPLASNATTEGKALNRRVEIVLFREK